MDAPEPRGERADDPFERFVRDLTSEFDLEPAPSFEHPRHEHRSGFDHDLIGIKGDVLRMGALVESQIRAAIAAMVAQDAEAALAVIRADAAVNELQRRVIGTIEATIATQAPVARDLRFLLTLDHVAYELERMGDHASSVAKQARKLVALPLLPAAGALPVLGERVADLVGGIVRALVDIDMVRAREVAAADDDVDALYHDIFESVVALMRSDAASVDPGTRILFAAHYLERIGDRVTNIAEDIVFLASGEVEDLNP